MIFTADQVVGLIDEAPFALHSLDAEGRIVWVNRTWERWFGYSAEEARGLFFSAFVPPEDWAKRAETFAAFRAGQLREVKNLRLRFRRKDGSTFEALLGSTAVRDPQGAWIRSRSIIVDVSDQLASELRFESYLDALPDAVLMVDARGQIDFANQRTYDLFGYQPGELLGQPVETLVPPRLRERHVGLRAGFFARPQRRPMGHDRELVARRKDGTEFPVEISLSPIAGASEPLIAAAVRDVSERKRLEAERQILRDRFVNAVESSKDAVLIYDPADRLVAHNSAGQRLLGEFIEGPVLGRAFAELIEATLAGVPPSDAITALRARRIAFHKDPVGTMDIPDPRGRLWRVSARRTADGGVIETIEDRTEDHAREEELRLARDAADAANTAKSEFLASMSHELRTPLNAVLGFAQLLQRDKKSPLSERQQGHVTHILRGAEHLLRLIDDVLDLARIEAGRASISLERVAVDTVLDEVVSALTPMAERHGVELEVVRGRRLEIVADRTRFAQILLNYGSNAIKYGRSGTYVTFRAARTDGHVRVTVSDKGPGIPLERQAKLFQPFHRAGQETGPIEGTGIGLAISRRLADLMNGTVGFHSEPGHGSDFWIELPIAGDEVPQAALIAFPERPASVNGATCHEILYVEDNPDNVAFMAELIATLSGVGLVSAHTAEIGLEIARARRPALIILDINLPGMSGFEALRQLRQLPETATIPVIALSASATTRDIRAGEEAGFDRYLTKPIRVDGLIAAIEALMQRDLPAPA